jgi:hypothetical protein
MTRAAAQIKAIETVYKGYRFRSRLEARWAVFFDTLDLPYEYELEGFELGGGLRYLPDFFLPDLGVHVEVKPHEKLSKAEIHKLVKFAADHDQCTLLIVGSPTSESMYYLNRFSLPSWRELEEHADEDDLRAVFWEQAREGSVQIAPLPKQGGWHLVYRELPAYYDYARSEALLAAKQARFEHGEKPR